MKMDRKLVASKQPHEVRYILKKYPEIPQAIVLAKLKQAGRSRVKLYQLLLDYVIKKKK